MRMLGTLITTALHRALVLPAMIFMNSLSSHADAFSVETLWVLFCFTFPVVQLCSGTNLVILLVVRYLGRKHLRGGKACPIIDDLGINSVFSSKAMALLLPLSFLE